MTLFIFFSSYYVCVTRISLGTTVFVMVASIDAISFFCCDVSCIGRCISVALSVVFDYIVCVWDVYKPQAESCKLKVEYYFIISFIVERVGGVDILCDVCECGNNYCYSVISG